MLWIIENMRDVNKTCRKAMKYEDTCAVHLEIIEWSNCCTLRHMSTSSFVFITKKERGNLFSELMMLPSNTLLVKKFI